MENHGNKRASQLKFCKLRQKLDVSFKSILLTIIKLLDHIILTQRRMFRTTIGLKIESINKLKELWKM